ncbi:MAG: hypothetical protein M3Y72_11235 [Acidobacteriota bacterium]|nr:hypothetical protein [Acidobacteriota bacterium]
MNNCLRNDGLEMNGSSFAFPSYCDTGADNGPAGYNNKYNVSATAVYAVPVGRGQQYFSGTNLAPDEVLGCWKLSMASVSYSGFRETLTGGNSNSNACGNERVNQYRPLTIVNPSPYPWCGTNPPSTPCSTPPEDNGVYAFSVPATNAFGTSRNGAVRGLNCHNVDRSVVKDFRAH